MPHLKNKNGYEVFNDGKLSICDAEDRIITKTKVANIRFGKRTVGVTRHWLAKTAGNKVNMVVSIPADVKNAELIEINDIVIIEGEQFQINQVQPKYDAKPPVIYLSLEKVMHPFADRRSDG